MFDEKPKLRNTKQLGPGLTLFAEQEIKFLYIFSGCFCGTLMPTLDYWIPPKTDN